MSSETLSHDEAIGQFCGVTGANEERARGLLEACEWNLELAINMHVDTDPDGRSSRKPTVSSADGPSTSTAGATNSNQDVNMQTNDDADNGNETSRRSPFMDTMAPRRQPEFGRFMSGRATSSASTSYQNSDEVRPPIAPVRQILNPNPIDYPSAVMGQRRYNTRTGAVSDIQDAFRDFQAEAQWQELAQEGIDANSESGAKTMAELFRPPLELMFRGSLASARECGTTQNKWLLVNVQNGKEFKCHSLNRDVWSHQAVKDILKEHFIYWQVYHDTYEGQRYVQFYHVSSFPHVAIIDPRTGELLKSWPTTIDHNSFCDSVIEFLTEHPSPDGSGDASTMKKLRVKKDEDDEDDVEIIATRTTLYDQSEEAQLEAAIKASLKESEKMDQNDDTIDIDEDTVELDLQDQQNQIDRDRELIERSPTHHNSVNATNKVESPPRPSRSTPSDHRANNNCSKQPIRSKVKSDKTMADSLRIASADIMPCKLEGPECKIALRFPDGSSMVQNFSAKEQLAAVRSFVRLEESAADATNIEFIAPPNRKLNDSMMHETLESLGLCPASRLEVRCSQD